MIRNYFLLAWRNIWKHGIFSLINISGLAIGISAALVIYLVVEYELGFDNFQKDKHRIYRVVSDLTFPGQVIQNPGVPSPLADALRTDISGLENVSAFHQYNAEVKVQVPVKDSSAPYTFKRQTHVVFADDNYFNLIEYKWLAGKPALLKEPFNVVLTAARAALYFPKFPIEECIGKTIIYNDSIQVTIKGIVENLTKRTDFIFEEFISLSTIPNSGLKNNFGWETWNSVNSSSQLFVKLMPNSSVQQLEKQITGIYKKYVDDEDAMDIRHKLQPLADIHYNALYGNYSEHLAHKPTLAGLTMISIFLLLLACINFINLSTAHSSQRSKEIGVRKTLGANKASLVLQFLIETFLLTLLATIISFLFSPLIIKIFADFIPAEITLTVQDQPHILGFLILLMLTVTILSGIIPALMISRHQPVLALKNQVWNNTGISRKAWTRKTLTVFQFVIAQFLVITTLFVVKQIQFAMKKEMGFNKEAIINFNTPWNIFDSLKQEKLCADLRSIPGIKTVILSGSPPASANSSTSSISFQDDKKTIETMVEIKQAGPDYFEFYQMKMLSGRAPAIMGNRESELVINETFARFLGFTDPSKAIGIMLKRNETLMPVVGVVSDFHYKSLHNQIKPLAFGANRGNFSIIHIALKEDQGKGKNWAGSIKEIEKAWKKTYPENDFSYHFLDEYIAKFYQSEMGISKLLKWATGLCILISCLGLLGLVMHSTQQRLKEIGIRKVLGASIREIISLLSREFISLVILAFIIAAPLAWLSVNKWLDNYAYRTQLSWYVFILSGVLMLLTAIMTMSILTFRAANANPVKSLRTE